MKGNTIQELLAERVESFAVGERPTAIIDTAIEKLFKDLVEEAFRSYGDFGKAVKDAVKAAMPSNVSDMFELTRYNTLIVNELRSRWLASGVGADFLRRAQAALDEAVTEDAIPERVRLSELLESFVEEHREDADANGWERPCVIIKEDDPCGNNRYITIGFDEQPEDAYSASKLYGNRDRRSVHQLKNYLAVSVSSNDEDGDPVGRVYSARLDGKPVGRDFSITTRWERLLAALYFGAADLVVDCDEYEICYPGRD